MTNITKLAQEIDNLVNSFVKKAENPILDYGESIKDKLLKKYQNSIQNEAAQILQKISDDIWAKTEEAFGYFEIDAHISIKQGNVTLSFALSENLGVNKRNNTSFAIALNSKLSRKYSQAMTRYIVDIKGGADLTTNFTPHFFQMSGTV